MHCRNRIAAGMAVSLLVSVSFLGGCDFGEDVKPPKGNDPLEKAADNGDPGGDVGKQPVGPPKKPPVPDWPQPAAALLLSGNQIGYIEPCGCSEQQSGGLSRRADLLRRLKKKNWPTAGLDLGNMVKRSRRQSQVKFETAIKALDDMDYRALALGPTELALGADFLLSQHTFDPERADAGFPFLAANVILFGTADLGTPRATTVFSVGKIKVGTTAILSPAFAKEILQVTDRDTLNVIAPDEPLKAAVAALKAQKPDLLVLLSHADLDESRRLAKAFPDFDLILSAGGYDHPTGKPETVRNTLIVTVGKKAQHVGLVGFYPDDKQNRLRFELVDLDRERFLDTDAMLAHMKQYQKRLEKERVAATELPVSHESGALYVGSAKCGECHTKAFKKWKATPHANAFESLKHPRNGQADFGITRIYDPECLACHVTGWDPENILRFKGGFVNEEFAKDAAEKELGRILKGSGCENCHGPGSQHVALVEAEKLDDARKLMRVTLKTARDSQCIICHDLDNSPNFEFDKYWKRIAHPGLD
jgi:hypothetical protein